MNTKMLQHIGRVSIVDMEALWSFVSEIPSENRVREMLRAVGVRFFDEEGYYISEPVAAIAGVGGIPLTLSDSHEKEEVRLGAKEAPVSLSAIAGNLKQMMGYGGFFSYMNPRNASPINLAEKMHGLGHFSTAHTAYLNIAVFGVSTAVENEFNSQRDLIHLARLTEARTMAQNNPPVVVLYPELLPVFKSIREHTNQCVTALKKPEYLDTNDFIEARNLSYPASKATLFLISGTLRNLQKLTAAISDPGKEEEYRRILLKIHIQLQELFPSMFQPVETMGYKLPAHLSAKESF